MPRSRNGFTISLVLVASLLMPSVSLAQVRTSPTSDWSAISGVATGSKVSVKLKNGKTVNGKLRSASDTILSLSVSNKLVQLNRDEVLSVYEIQGKSAKKPALIGLGIGAAAGAAVGAAGGDDNGFFISRAQLAAGMSVLGAAAGALTGFLIGKSGRKRVLIYEAKQP
ncbi:MAG: hypothetical protein ACREBG_27565 [Pyrinomonadaceae bacterium]